MRWTSRRKARLTAIGALAVTTAMVPGTAPAVGEQRTEVTLPYNCQFPSGPQQVSVKISTLFPAIGMVDQALHPRNVTASVDIPQSGLTDLTATGASTVSGTARLTTQVAENGTPSTASWSGLAAPSTPLPSTGDLNLTEQGSVPAETPSIPGYVTFAAGDFNLTMALRKADGTETSPANIQLACTPKPGVNTTLANVPVGGADSLPSGRRSAAVVRQNTTASTAYCPPLPDPKGLNRSLLPTPPPNSFILDPNPQPQAGCANAAGYTNATKLNGSAPVGPDLTNLAIGVRVVFNVAANYIEEDSVGQVQLSPKRATFLTFGFMPTSATMELTALDPLTIYSVGIEKPPYTQVTTIATRVSLRINDVKVNGTPLDVGPRCGASTPIDLTLKGSSDSTPPYTLQGGGPVSGTIKIPSFTGCGVGENLNPLFTSAISGSDFVEMTQAPPCFSQNSNQPGCPPATPTPKP